ncbi:hypothetical protein P7K49_002043 [Saguinus oedipus]|uniref:Uncharacterized protein n=1 Tax=Saguinus oedipus TaxID=9490 RepID=A0ABQ9WG63_SAGOE|nr:hypothetical protein P7K49_002043 [Saguinus oedipus]
MAHGVCGLSPVVHGMCGFSPMARGACALPWCMVCVALSCGAWCAWLSPVARSVCGSLPWHVVCMGSLPWCMVCVLSCGAWCVLSHGVWCAWALFCGAWCAWALSCGTWCVCSPVVRGVHGLSPAACGVCALLWHVVCVGSLPWLVVCVLSRGAWCAWALSRVAWCVCSPVARGVCGLSPVVRGVRELSLVHGVHGLPCVVHGTCNSCCPCLVSSGKRKGEAALVAPSLHLPALPPAERPEGQRGSHTPNPCQVWPRLSHCGWLGCPIPCSWLTRECSQVSSSPRFPRGGTYGCETGQKAAERCGPHPGPQHLCGEVSPPATCAQGLSLMSPPCVPIILV